MLIFFHAKWCGQCKVMEPMIEEVAKELEEDLQVIDVEEDEDITKDYQVMTLPTIINTDTGKRITGVVSKEILKERLTN